MTHAIEETKWENKKKTEIGKKSKIHKLFMKKM